MKEHRLIGAFAASILALCVAGIAHAQEPPGTRATPCNLATPNNALCIVVTPPTVNEDGTPIVLALTYRVERLVGSTWTPVTTTASTLHYLTGLAPGTYTFRVLAIAGGRESLPSNTAARDVQQPAPAPPVIQVVQVVIGENVAPVFTVLSNGTLSKTWVGFARVGVACDGPSVSTYLGYQWRRPAEWGKRKGISSSARVAAPCSS